MKILFLLIAGGGPIHDEDEFAQRRTWAAEDSDYCQVIWLRSHSGQQYEFRDRTLFVPCDGSFNAILEKTILGMGWVSKNLDFDYLIRSNTSTYFDVRSIRRRISRIKEGQVGGIFETTRKNLDGFEKGYRYLNGSGLYMTKKSTEFLSSLDPRRYESTPDDIAIYHFLNDNGTKFIRLHRNNLDLHHIFLPFSQIRVKSWSNPKLTTVRMMLVHNFFLSTGITHRTVSWLKVERNELHHAKVSFGSLYRLLNRTVKFMGNK
jgi:hypothetical protein